jgi:hypothetical protein
MALYAPASKHQAIHLLVIPKLVLFLERNQSLYSSLVYSKSFTEKTAMNIHSLNVFRTLYELRVLGKDRSMQTK